MTSPENLPAPARETLVVELTPSNAVGTDTAGEQSVHRYLTEVAQLIRRDLLQEPRDHLSPKYGLSGYVPLTRQSAVHLYAWDHLEQSEPPFVSVDVSTAEALPNQSEVIDHARQFFGASEHETVWKTQEQARHWRQLASHIHRQRISMAGVLEDQTNVQQQVQKYLDDLPGVLNMVDLSGPIVLEGDWLEKYTDPFPPVINRTGSQGLAFWGHWETSGYVGNVQDGNFAVDVYTCKEFDPEVAEEFTRRSLQLAGFGARSF